MVIEADMISMEKNCLGFPEDLHTQNIYATCSNSNSMSQQTHMQYIDRPESSRLMGIIGKRVS